jgi:hypothetical protein
LRPELRGNKEIEQFRVSKKGENALSGFALEGAK